jgi:osmotically-inducible protein OsmY
MKTDVQLRHEVLDALDQDPCIDASRIAVTTREGVVTLTGSVPVYAQKFAAEEAVERVPGVEAIANAIEVRPPDGGQPADAHIAATALHALHWEAAVPQDHVRVIVRDRWITLDGTVAWQYQKDAADRAVRALVGARGVSNLLLVKPKEGVEPHEAWRAFQAVHEVPVGGNCRPAEGRTAGDASHKEMPACGSRALGYEPW